MADVIDRVKAFFLEDDSFETTFHTWAQSHASRIDLTTDENKLDYTTLHNEFLAFFESKLESVIKESSGTPESFYKLIKSEVDEHPDGEDAFFVQIMLAAVEFQVFIQMMREVAAEVARK